MKCPECGHEMIKAGKFTKRSGHYQRFKCQQCGRYVLSDYKID